MRARRMDLIQRCIDENQTNITHLREKDAPLGVVRNAQNVVSIFFLSEQINLSASLLLFCIQKVMRLDLSQMFAIRIKIFLLCSCG